jgi:hypothetical protein
MLHIISGVQTMNRIKFLRLMLLAAFIGPFANIFGERVTAQPKPQKPDDVRELSKAERREKSRQHRESLMNAEFKDPKQRERSLEAFDAVEAASEDEGIVLKRGERRKYGKHSEVIGGEDGGIIYKGVTVKNNGVMIGPDGRRLKRGESFTLEDGTVVNVAK